MIYRLMGLRDLGAKKFGRFEVGFGAQLPQLTAK